MRLFPERLPGDVTLGRDLDLQAEEFVAPSGRRLTQPYADELVARLVGPVPEHH